MLYLERSDNSVIVGRHECKLGVERCVNHGEVQLVTLGNLRPLR